MYVYMHVVPTHAQSYAADEIHFNLMAVVSDRKRELSKKIASLEEKRDMAAQRVRVTHTHTHRYMAAQRVRVTHTHTHTHTHTDTVPHGRTGNDG